MSFFGQPNSKFNFIYFCFILTVLFPILCTRQFRYAVFPTRIVTFFDAEISKYGRLSNKIGLEFCESSKFDDSERKIKNISLVLFSNRQSSV